MNEHNYVVIMAGGVGSRFWPFSREDNPKQFHDVLGDGQTMLQTTEGRFMSICPPENVYVVTSRDYLDLVRRDLPHLEDNQILLEPVRRNTAPCVAYACYKIASRDPQANIVVCPSDHVISKPEIFQQKLLTALAATAGQDILVTLGIRPDRPDTGYGYIQYIEDGKSPLKKVKTFTEKPKLELAKVFVESGDFVWNAGIFVWNVQAIIRAFETHMPDMAEIFSGGDSYYYTDTEESFINKAYSQCKVNSIDYGVMEKAENAYVVLSEFGWSDLGTWKSLYAIAKKDGDGNTIDGNVLTYDTSDCIVRSSKDKLIVIQGLKDYIVTENDGVIMICKLEEEQRVKEFVKDVKATQPKGKFI